MKKCHICKKEFDEKNEQHYKFGNKYICYSDEGDCIVTYCGWHFVDQN